MIKEIRKLSWYDLRNMCVRENFYTCGTCEEYDKLYEYVSNLENVTTKDIVNIAKDIMKHSEVDEDMELISICYLIGRECRSNFIEEKRKCFYEIKTEWHDNDYYTETTIYQYGGKEVFYEKVKGIYISDKAAEMIVEYQAEEA